MAMNSTRTRLGLFSPELSLFQFFVTYYKYLCHCSQVLCFKLCMGSISGAWSRVLPLDGLDHHVVLTKIHKCFDRIDPLVYLQYHCAGEAAAFSLNG